MGDADKTLDALRARLVTEERKINQRIAQGQQPSAGTSQASTSNENNALYGEAGPGPSARTQRNGGGFGRGRRPNTYQTTVSYIHQHKFNYVHHNVLFVFQNQIRTKEQIARDSAYCTYCKKSRHYAFECRKRIADEGERQANGAKRANIANDNPTATPERRDDFVFVSTSCLSACEPNVFYLDSGCTQHMSDQKHYFSRLHHIEPGTWSVGGIGGKKLFAHGIGDIEVEMMSNGEKQTGTIKDALYVPNLNVNLISVACITDNGYQVLFVDNMAHISKNGQNILSGSRVGKTLYRLDLSAQPRAVFSMVASSNKATMNVWHERFAHVNEEIIIRMANGEGVSGMEVIKDGKKILNPCHGCSLGKMHKLPFETSKSITTQVGELIHSDVVGPMQVSSPNGARYYILFKDDFSRYKTVYFMKLKSEAIDCTKLFTKKTECETGKRVRMLRSDNGGEFTGNEFKQWLSEQGIMMQTSAAHTPEQNGKAERDHRTTVEAARSIIHAKKLSLTLWAEAVNYSVYTLNRTFSKRRHCTPYELWHGKQPNVSNLRVFGSTAYVFVPDAERQKLDAKAIKGIYVGECENQKASRIFVESTGKTHISRHVKVYENTNHSESEEIINLEAPVNHVNEKERINTVANKKDLSNKETGKATTPVRKSLRGRVPKKQWGMVADEVMEAPSIMATTTMAFQAFEFIFYEPKTFKEAMESSEGNLWKLATDDEMLSHAKNNTWTVVPLPPGRVCIPSGWNFKIKTGKDGLPKRRKARFFAKGYRQTKGIDYQETFAPVVRYDSLRVLIAIAASRDLELTQLDVKTAFLNGEIEEEIFISQPEGYIVTGREKEVCRLNKSLYGIKQASRIWNQKLHSSLIAFGLNQSNADPCIYYRFTKDHMLIIAIWVDDGLVAASDLAITDKAVNFLNKNFEMEYGPADHFVGLVISRDRINKRIFLAAPQYIDKVLSKFNMSNCHPVTLPADKGATALSKEMSPQEQEEREIMSNVPYREAVGSIMYAAITVRPDIAFIAGQLAKFCENPGPTHWKAAKRVLKYLAGTRNHGLCFNGRHIDNNLLTGYSDADYAGDSDTRRSTSGFVFVLNGAAVTWSSRRQPIVALSTMESEYIAASDASREVIWLRRLLSELGEEQTNPTRLLCDNESAISLTRNPESHKRSKHIDVRYHFIREQIFKKTIEISYVNTREQLADAFTKAIDEISQSKIMAGLGIVEVPEEDV
jgi:hypothetical protein